MATADTSSRLVRATNRAREAARTSDRPAVVDTRPAYRSRVCVSHHRSPYSTFLYHRGYQTDDLKGVGMRLSAKQKGD
jgi:hypothetical protein